ncbi:MAG TPA: type II toxin-antitoxin system VapC family toxin [Gemmataceae bacterium]|jgi:predicted nucleic acid-binding protein
MNTLLDTSILARTAQPTHSLHRLALDALAELRRQGDTLCIVPQNIYEFWVVCTRPVAQNGLGMSPAEAEAELTRLKSLFTILDDTAAIFPQWEQLVMHNQIQGKTAHDARLVAAMMVHGVNRVLTFNVSDFQRFHTLTVLDPQHVVDPPP